MCMPEGGQNGPEKVVVGYNDEGDYQFEAIPPGNTGTGHDCHRAVENSRTGAARIPENALRACRTERFGIANRRPGFFTGCGFRSLLMAGAELRSLWARLRESRRAPRVGIDALYPLKDRLPHGFRRRKTFLQRSDRPAVYFDLFRCHGSFSSIDTDPSSKPPAMIKRENEILGGKARLRLGTAPAQYQI